MTKTPQSPEPERIRIDKWLWQARFCKTRALAAHWVGAGRIRLNGQRIDKPGRAVGPGDVLTLGGLVPVRVLRITACGTRRGPAPEAATLYILLPDSGPDRGGEAADPAGKSAR